MNKKKKAFILLPDGVGLRNFAFGNFYKEGNSQDFDITYWNNTKFPVTKLGYKEIPIVHGKPRAISDLYKRAKINIELKQNQKNFNNNVYLSYIFPSNLKNIKSIIKTLIVNFLIFFYNTPRGLQKIRKKIYKLERNSAYYLKFKATLQQEKPAVVFLTNQRPLTAIAPLLAAQDLKIPTITFIFSWDNLPKGTLVVESDYYFVWSKFMKLELLKYYPDVKENQVVITGTPQFECHYNTVFKTKEAFFKEYNLNLNKKYICFSGDDVTTSPNDQFYLEDLAKIVRKLNKKGHNLGIIYRKCPVDFTNRHLEIYHKYKEEIVLIDPKWENLGNSWNQVMPLPEDLTLLANTVHFSELVINVGSSMVFDFVAQNKPCAFLNYNTVKKSNKNWHIKEIYKFIHFQSMPNKKAVLWVDSPKDMETIILNVLNKKIDLEFTKKWYCKIVAFPQDKASERIWLEINKIICT
ncbi:UDP-glycosyltransferase [Polaribacter batillariae]|uniref:UDP-glycosyltransferase n=1 Tax=Polaribacter batillariae TaxID=2808900 RepID=A0ABX7STJ8_9FLAO|nr:UDP-glycosyltransferase [Polaribacter batillariae]QTD37569.1 UDP-glycosyltransferase [Polaribacter batillariae]